MAQCVAVDVDGLLRVSAAEPCVSYVVVSPAEYAAMSVNPFNLSVEDGAQISLLIIGVWVVAFCCRALVQGLSDGHSTQGET